MARGTSVTENFEPVSFEKILSPDGRRGSTQTTVTRVSVERLRINHYCVKSQADYLSKGKDPSEEWRYNRQFFNFHDRNEVMDPILHCYLPDLKTALQWD